MTALSSRSVKSTGIASLACSVCRKQHLKCDAGKPSCSRCTEADQVCYYEPSRRGGRRKQRRTPAQESQQPTPQQKQPQQQQPTMQSYQHQRQSSSFVDCVTVNPTSLPLSPNSTSQEAMSSSSNVAKATNTSNDLVQSTLRPAQQPSRPGSLLDERQFSEEDHTRGTRPTSHSHDDHDISRYTPLDTNNIIPHSLESSNLGSIAPPPRPWSDQDRLLRLYYENFHNAHPFLVPSSVFTSRGYPNYLRRVIDFAGSHYTPSGPNSQLRAEVEADLMSTTDTSTCMVQSLLIYSILLFFSNEIDAASTIFDQCTRMAMELGMHLADFAASRHLDNPIEAESLRRTWWEIYITDISMAIPPKTMNLRCSSTRPEVCLPCEEVLYNGRLDIPNPHHVLEFKRRILSTGDVAFSSFSYRIEAATILGRVLLLNQLKNTNHDHTQSIENALLSWSNHLPTEKLEIVDSYGNINEMMFQAHVLIALASMLLHLPRSNLYPLLVDTKDPFLPLAQHNPLSTSTGLIQGIKATDASRRISDCISLCPNVLKHTPFVIPALAICGFIQLATSQGHADECFEQHYNRVTVVLGCLKNARRMWRMAESEYDQVRCCTSELIADAIDRMNSLPLSQTIPNPSLPTPSTPGQGGELAIVSPERRNPDPAMPRLDPYFLDPVCYDYSLFSALPDFNPQL